MGCLCNKPVKDSPLIESENGEQVPVDSKNKSNQRSSYYQDGSETIGKDKINAYSIKEFQNLIAHNPQSIDLNESDHLVRKPTALITEFELIQVLGRGSFGKVILVKRKKKLYAMKILKKFEVQARKQKQHTQYERLILAVTNSNFIVKLHFAFQTKDKLYLVVDFQQGGELFFHLRKSNRFIEDKARFYAAELLLALEHLHSQNIVYRDLKPENIIIGKNGHIKITDFGLSKFGMIKDEKSYSFVGTPEYLAPEILIGQGHDFICDFWSLGSLIYEMLSGSPPFYSRDRELMYKNRLEKPIDMKNYFSDQATSLLTGLLCNDPRYRLGSGGHKEIKTHEFFKDIDWAKLEALKIQPPFIPELDNDLDLKYFDPQFTKEPARNTPGQTEIQTQEKYPYFSYERGSLNSHFTSIAPQPQQYKEIV